MNKDTKVFGNTPDFWADKPNGKLINNQAAKIQAIQLELEQVKKFNQELLDDNSRLSSEHSLNLYTINQLRSDKARLVGALRETTKYLGTSAELLIGTLKHANEKLLTEMEDE